MKRERKIIHKTVGGVVVAVLTQWTIRLPRFPGGSTTPCPPSLRSGAQGVHTLLVLMGWSFPSGRSRVCSLDVVGVSLVECWLSEWPGHSLTPYSL